MSQEGLVFKMSCPDAVGLVAARGLNLAEAHSYSDVASRWFFARLRIEGAADPACVRAALEGLRR